jgi:hypothetical protein
MATPVAAPVGAEQVRFKGRGWRNGRWEGLINLLHPGNWGRLRRFNLPHRGDQGLFALFDRSFAIRLQQFADMTYEIRISKYFGPVSSDRRAHAPFLVGIMASLA